MKKRNLLVAFLLAGTLASCASTAPAECPECPECPTPECPECPTPECPDPTPTQEELDKAALEAKSKTISKALEKFNSDFTATFTLNNSRHYANPFNVLNNITVKYQIINKYDFIENTNFVRYVTEAAIFRPNEEPITVPTEEGLFDKTTGIQIFEYLNHRNELAYRPILDEANSTPLTMDLKMGKNIFSALNAGDFTPTLEDAPIAVDGSFLETPIYNYVGYSGGIKSLNATLEGETLTKLDATFEDFENRFSESGNFGGDKFVESLSGTIEFDYTPLTLEGKTPVPSTPIASLETVLEKFRANPTNYTVKYGPSADFMTYQVLRDGDKLALDVADLMTDLSLGGLTWLDARLEKGEDGKFFVNNVVMDEATEEIGWLTNEQIIDQSLNYDEAGERLPEEQCTPLPLDELRLDIADFDMDFANIDTSIFTLQEDGSALLKGDSAKYFGECLINPLVDQSGFGIAMGLISQYGWTGVEWKLKAIDENSIAFEGKCTLSLGAAQSTSYLYGTLTNAGTTDATALYGELTPSLPEPEPLG